MSIVSVSRVALPPQLRTGRVLPGRMPVERIARQAEFDILGQFYRQILALLRYGAAGRAVNHRDRAAPVALPRNTPVAQAVVHLPAALRCAAEVGRFEPPRDFGLRLLDAHAVEEARIDEHARPVIGGLASNLVRSGIRRADHDRVAQPVFGGEFEVALVMRGTAENRAGAVIHQHEIRDMDRQRPVGIERMGDAQAGVVAEFLGRLDRRFRRAARLAVADEGGEPLGPSRRASSPADVPARSP